MCGIYGVIAKDGNAKEKVLNGLEKLEYRGYDSAGLAIAGKELKIIKSQGKVSNLIKKALDFKQNANIAFGHNRWATHGASNETNCHPHVSNDGNFCVVHNGIIENYVELKSFLLKNNFSLYSQTDTEVFPNLVQYHFQKLNNLTLAIKKSLAMIKGSFAFILYSKHKPNSIYCIRNQSPLVVAKTKNSLLASSDIQAIENCEEVYVLNSGEIAVLSDDINFYNFNFKSVKKTKFNQCIKTQCSNNKGFEYFMQKEILECYECAKNTFEFYKNSNLTKAKKLLKNAKRIFFVGCGTTFHACLYAQKFLLENGVDCHAEIASEFAKFKALLNEKCVCVFVSQSGETADTIKALELAKSCNAKTISITNIEGSTISLMADLNLKTLAGVERGVAATKTYISQLMCIMCLFENINMGFMNILLGVVKKIKTQQNLQIEQNFIEKIKNYKQVYFVGRGYDFITCKEASLKLKEISYMFSDAYPAGELKHGSLATISCDTVVFAICTSKNELKKMTNTVHEVKARGAYVVVATNQDFSNFDDIDYKIKLEKCQENVAPIISIIPFFKIAMQTSIAKGLNPDKPRNLAKSVTVE